MIRNTIARAVLAIMATGLALLGSLTAPASAAPPSRIAAEQPATSTTAGLTVAGGIVTSPPAVAGVNCAAGYHCLFYSDVNSSKHSYFDSVNNFNGDVFTGGNGIGSGQAVNNNSWAASNSSTGNRESHYYDSVNHVGFLFCVNPGATVHSLPSNLRDRASSLRLRPRTSVVCLSN